MEISNNMEENLKQEELVKIAANVMDMYVKESITTCLKLFPKFKQTDTLVITLYNVLKSMFVDDKDHVILSAPTGTGKSVIGYMINFCFCYMTERINKTNLSYDEFSNQFRVDFTNVTTYTLTSSKVLQEQIDGDIKYFGMDNNLGILKGVRNYECTKQTKDTGEYHNYSERYCTGMPGEEKQQLPCYNTCPYIQQRFHVSGINNAILNYAYFLNVLKSDGNPFFGIRDLTICDEAHLIPDIVSGMFNVDLSMMYTNKILDLIKSLNMNFPSVLKESVTRKIKNEENDEITLEVLNIEETLKSNVKNLFEFFTKPLSNDKESLNIFSEKYWESFKNVVKIFDGMLFKMKANKVFMDMYQKDFNKFIDFVEFNDFNTFVTDMSKRPEDLFIESTEIGISPYEGVNGIMESGRYKCYKHNFYDLSESAMCRKYFLNKVNKAVYMSATLGNIDEFAILMGLNVGEYAGFRLESNFDFSKSPIYLVDSGYLNYNNFENTIDDAINDTLKICNKLHPNEKGIIHTSTFNIAQRLKTKIIEQQNLTSPERFLFYNNSSEKEKCIEMMKVSEKPLIIIGPSLFEGIDLKDDLGRFNITIKAPYSGMSTYTRKKMERYPFWYKRVVLEKLEQSIGRTNRHINDYSTNYLIDSVLNKLVFELPPHITKRVSFKKVY